MSESTIALCGFCMPPLRLSGERQLLRTVTLINGKDTERHEPFSPFFDSPHFHLRSELSAASPGGSNRRFPGRQNAWGKPSSCALRPCPRRAHPGTDARPLQVSKPETCLAWLGTEHRRTGETNIPTWSGTNGGRA